MKIKLYEGAVRCPANTFNVTFSAIDQAKTNESLINIPIN